MTTGNLFAEAAKAAGAGTQSVENLAVPVAAPRRRASAPMNSPRGKMHSGSMDSERLKRTWMYLLARQQNGSGPATTAEIAARTGSQAVHSDIAGVRANGIPVTCRYRGKSDNGAKVYEYALL